MSVPENCEIIKKYVFNKDTSEEKTYDYVNFDERIPAIGCSLSLFEARLGKERFVVDGRGKIFLKNILGRKIIKTYPDGRFYIYELPSNQFVGVAEFGGREIVPPAYNEINVVKKDEYESVYFFARTRTELSNWEVFDMNGRYLSDFGCVLEPPDDLSRYAALRTTEGYKIVKAEDDKIIVVSNLGELEGPLERVYFAVPSENAFYASCDGYAYIVDCATENIAGLYLGKGLDLREVAVRLSENTDNKISWRHQKIAYKERHRKGRF